MIVQIGVESNQDINDNEFPVILKKWQWTFQNGQWSYALVGTWDIVIPRWQLSADLDSSAMTYYTAEFNTSWLADRGYTYSNPVWYFSNDNKINAPMQLSAMNQPPHF